MSAAAARVRNAVLAGHAGDEDTARPLLTDAEPRVRIAALSALARMRLLSEVDLGAGLADSDPTVRRRAVELCAVTETPDVVPLLADSDDTVVEMAAWACGERSSTPTTIAALCQVVAEHGDALCREAAVAALGALGDPAGLPTILAACSDKATVRRRAVLALAPFEGELVDAALHHALTDRDWQVRQAAEDLLGVGGGLSDESRETSP